MARQGVAGNLLSQVVPQIQLANVVRVDKVALNENYNNNSLSMNGVVTLQMGSTKDQLSPHRYLVNVEFNDLGTDQIVRSFNMKEIN